MKNVILLMLAIVFSFPSLKAQEKKGTRDYLEEKRGFKMFNLGDNIDENLKYLEFSENSKSQKVYTVIDSTLLKAGSIELKEIYIYTFDNIISQIAIHVDNYNKRAFKDALIVLYGNDTYKPLKHKEYYIWMSENTELSINEEFNINEGLIVFKDYPLARKIKAADENVNSSNADDF